MSIQPSSKEQEQQSSYFSWKRWSIILVFALLLIIGISIWKLADLGVFPSYISTILKTFFAVIAAIFTIVVAVLTIIDKFFPVKTLFSFPVQPLPQNYNSILWTPPYTNGLSVSQRTGNVDEVYQLLSQNDVNALVLTGFEGVGKSTLAGLVYRYAEKQLLSPRKGSFVAKPLWLKISSNVTMIDLAGTLFKEMGRPMPDFSKLSALRQAWELFNLLNISSKSRLIVLDQFDHLLYWQTGQILKNHHGIGEWLEMLNNQPLDKSSCRLIFTSRLRPQIVSSSNEGLIKEYKVSNLHEDEGIVLLRQQGIQGDDDELRSIVRRCGGHAQSLVYSADIIKTGKVKTSNLSNDLDHLLQFGFNYNNGTYKLLDYIYGHQLTDRQHKLLLAFSSYREAMPLEAGLMVMNDGTLSSREISQDINVLYEQQLLSASEGLYQLQTIVTTYVQGQFDKDKSSVKTAHALAAQYYKQQITLCYTTGGKSSYIVHLLSEAVWQLCQAEQWQEAYILMEQDGLFADFKGKGKNIAFLEAFGLLLDSANWQPDPLQKAHILYNLGMILTDLGQKEQARIYYEEALAIWKEKGERKWEGVTLSNLGRVYSALGKKQEALKKYNYALDILRETGERVWIGTTLSHRGRVFGSLGQLERAKQSYESALSILKDENDHNMEGITMTYLGVIYCALGEKEKALEYCSGGLSIVEKTEVLRDIGRALNNLGRTYFTLGQIETAQAYYEKALKDLREARDRSGEGVVLQNLGDISRTTGKIEEAQKLYEQALSILTEVGDHWRESMVLNDLGTIYIASSQLEEAKKSYNKALTVRRAIEDRSGEGSTLYNIGKLFVLLKSYDIALAFFLLSKNTFISIGSSSKVSEDQINELHIKLGEAQFKKILDNVEAQLGFITEHALQEAV